MTLLFFFKSHYVPAETDSIDIDGIKARARERQKKRNELKRKRKRQKEEDELFFIMRLSDV